MALSTLSPSLRRTLAGALSRQHLASGGAAWRQRRSFYDEPPAPEASNALYVESIYTQWRADASQVDASWDAYFKSVQDGKPVPVPNTGSAKVAAFDARLSLAAKSASSVTKSVRLDTSAPEAEVVMLALASLVRAYRMRGHEVARLDPLSLNQWRSDTNVPDLDPSVHGLTSAHMAMTISPGGILRSGDRPEVTIGEFVESLRKFYCGGLGIEYMHMGQPNLLSWIQARIENPSLLAYSKDELVKMYSNLCLSDSFERYLDGKFKNTKRFGVDGGEAVVPGILSLMDRAAELGCDEFVIGMPHRGRLNVLCNIVGKPVDNMLALFLGTAYDIDGKLAELDSHDWSSAGDVKYHLGTSCVRKAGGKDVTVTIEANPSHLETVGAIALGRTKAKQYYLGNVAESRKRVLPILMHGDAAFAGQGVVYETMQLAKLADFDVGGTIHIVVNNQVGFTTDPKFSRSTHYCSDIGKAFNIPIFHCNGDDVLSVKAAFDMAAEWRQETGQDVIIDFICYRRFGHNESDNPDFTQPLLYKAVKAMETTDTIFAKELVAGGVVSQAEIDGIREAQWKTFDKDFESAKNYDTSKKLDWVATKWEGMRSPFSLASTRPTGMDASVLRRVGYRLCEVPEMFAISSSLRELLQRKREVIEQGTHLDWSTAEAMALGTLLLEGSHVRLTGRDAEQGCVSERNAVVYDEKTGTPYTFLNNLNCGPQETFVVRNSICAEYSVMGYELGYSYENPHACVLWEAAHGDFANTAQVIIDQFLCAGEHKWLTQSGLTVLLPHGYEGAGAEHSSARLERFLALCDDDEDDIPEEVTAQIQKANWQVANMTTPANYFHVLRAQMRRDFRKPLIVATPKEAQFLPEYTSPLTDMGPETKFQSLIAERDSGVAADGVDRLIFCSGKVYYDLVAEREKLGLTNVAICTVEMVAPFPFKRVAEEITKYPKVDKGDGVLPGSILWVQEEPKNMGCWQYVKPRMVASARNELQLDLVVRYVGRRTSAAAATGITAMHEAEQQALVRYALTGESAPANDPARPHPLLGHMY